ncbi:MAG: hypothetical protein IJI14_20055 [Anaerolineaceae bacterium]|nr:hypothetical protein [Anaerolineaceae bacterium]
MNRSYYQLESVFNIKPENIDPAFDALKREFHEKLPEMIRSSIEATLREFGWLVLSKEDNSITAVSYNKINYDKLAFIALRIIAKYVEDGSYLVFFNLVNDSFVKWCFNKGSLDCFVGTYVFPKETPMVAADTAYKILQALARTTDVDLSTAAVLSDLSQEEAKLVTECALNRESAAKKDIEEFITSIPVYDFIDNVWNPYCDSIGCGTEKLYDMRDFNNFIKASGVSSKEIAEKVNNSDTFTWRDEFFREMPDCFSSFKCRDVSDLKREKASDIAAYCAENRNGLSNIHIRKILANYKIA